MKKLLILVAILAFLLVITAQSVFAEGGKVRGDDSTGPSYQIGECPFKG